MFKLILRKFYLKIKFLYFKYHPIKFSNNDKFWVKVDKNKENINDPKYCIFISSRNNYKMLRKIVISKYKLKNIDFYNVDDNSEDNEKIYGRKLCKENNFIFLKNQSFGLQMALKTLIDYIIKNNKKYDFILYISHDNFPISRNFFSKLNNFFKYNKLDNIGCIGFNHLDYNLHKKEITKFKNEVFSIGYLGRAFLSSLNKSKIPTWYTSQTTNDFKKIKITGAFAIEGVADMAFAINLKNLIKFVNFSDQYRLHCWADDICLQFLQNNIYNIVIPSLIFLNVFEIKAKFGIPILSVSSANKNTKYHSDIYKYKKYWKERWRWDRAYLPTDEVIYKYYSNTLIEKFCKHDFSYGPLKTFNYDI